MLLLATRNKWDNQLASVQYLASDALRSVISLLIIPYSTWYFAMRSEESCSTLLPFLFQENSYQISSRGWDVFLSTLSVCKSDNIMTYRLLFKPID